MTQNQARKTFSITSALLASSITAAQGAPPAATTRTAASQRAVSQEQFNQLLRVFKRTIDRVEQLEKRPVASGGGRSDDSVDLSKLDSKPATATNKGPHGGASSGTPNFKVYFDLNLVNRPGIVDFSFQNYHSLLMFELLPSADLQFTFDINPSPRFYELDYQITPKLQFRAGKIWIPFDDLNPHNLFGGRINASKLAPSTTSSGAFLPDLWTELGVGIKYQVLDTRALKLEAHGYIVNGFGSGGSDPLLTAPSYPYFGDPQIGSTDNNRDKALGFRGHALIGGTFGAGISYYRGQWSDDGDAEPQGLSMMGLDGQVRLHKTGTEIRVGMASMSVDLFDSSVTRGGYYGEVGQKFGAGQKWKVLLRGGEVQLDNRVIAVSDQQIVGATLLYNPGMIQYSIEHSRDLKDIPGKLNTQYTALRLIVAL